MAEDYRAGLGIDRATDDADRAAGRQLACPTLVVWSTEDDMQDLYGDVLSIWRPWASDLRGAAIPSGHHMAEEAPDELATAHSSTSSTTKMRPNRSRIHYRADGSCG